MPITSFPGYGAPYTEDGKTYPPTFEAFPRGRIVRLTTGTAATWTVPVGVYLLKWVLLVGGGRGGGGGSGKNRGSSGSLAGFGGYGGAYGKDLLLRNVPVVPGTTVLTYTIGAGGAGGAGGDATPADGTSGGDTNLEFVNASGTTLSVKTGVAGSFGPMMLWDKTSGNGGFDIANNNPYWQDGLLAGMSFSGDRVSQNTSTAWYPRYGTYPWTGEPGIYSKVNAYDHNGTYDTIPRYGYSSDQLPSSVLGAAGSNGGTGSGGTAGTAGSGGPAGLSGGGGSGGGASTSAAGTGYSPLAGGGGGGGAGRFIATGTTAIVGGVGGNASANSGAGGGGGGGANSGGTGTTTGGAGGNGGSGVIIICY